jgi:hypothetical protein
LIRLIAKQLPHLASELLAKITRQKEQQESIPPLPGAPVFSISWRFSIQSTWFPAIDRNPQVFRDVYQAKEPDFQIVGMTGIIVRHWR